MRARARPQTRPTRLCRNRMPVLPALSCTHGPSSLTLEMSCAARASHLPRAALVQDEPIAAARRLQLRPCPRLRPAALEAAAKEEAEAGQVICMLHVDGMQLYCVECPQVTPNQGPSARHAY